MLVYAHRLRRLHRSLHLHVLDVFDGEILLSTSKSINTVSSAVRSTDGTSLNPCSISLAVSSATEPLNNAAEILIACSNASSP